MPDIKVKDTLLYTPTGRDLEANSISLDAMHINHTKEIDVHSLFGTMQAIATREWFETSKKTRTFTLSRSTYTGYGKFGSHWLGDNFSNVANMGYSVTGIMTQAINGVPLTGADVCGFHGDTTPELCARWHMVAAFQPFSRNHYS